MESLVLIVFLIIFIILGAPIGIIMVALPTVYILITGELPLVTIPYQMYEAIAHGPLIAIPFFMLTGELMNTGGITDRLLALSRELVGRMRGGLAQISVVVSMLFAGMNGSAVADSAVVGSLLIPAMKKAGYSGAFAAGLIATCGTIGGIIPPSIIMILLASSLNLSVGALFSAGILPGILIGVLLMIMCYVMAIFRNYERLEEPFTFKALWDAFLGASLALMIPVVLVGGIITGIFGTVEAGAITALAALIIGGFIYRTLSWSEFTGATGRAVRTSASVFIIIAAAGPFGWMLSRLGALNFLEAWLLGFADQPVLFIAAFLGFIILAGMIMEVVALVIVLGPTLVKVMEAVGYHQYQAALIVCVGFLLGLVTPPVGVSYFTAAAIARESLEKVAIAIVPFILVEVFALILLILIPGLSLWVPQLLGFL